MVFFCAYFISHYVCSTNWSLFFMDLEKSNKQQQQKPFSMNSNNKFAVNLQGIWKADGV